MVFVLEVLVVGIGVFCGVMTYRVVSDKRKRNRNKWR